jgi:hypothetical protein
MHHHQKANDRCELLHREAMTLFTYTTQADQSESQVQAQVQAQVQVLQGTDDHQINTGKVTQDFYNLRR